MANNDEHVLVHSYDDDHQPPLANPAILLIGFPPEEELDLDDEEEMRMEAIWVEVNNFYDVLENLGRRSTSYFRCPICRGSSRTKLINGLMSLIRNMPRW